MELSQEQQKALAKIRDDWEIINEYDRGAGVGISGQQRVARTLLDIIDTLQAQPPALEAESQISTTQSQGAAPVPEPRNWKRVPRPEEDYHLDDICEVIHDDYPISWVGRMVKIQKSWTGSYLVSTLDDDTRLYHHDELVLREAHHKESATFEPRFERRPLDAPDPEQPRKKHDWYPKSTDRGGDHE